MVPRCLGEDEFLFHNLHLVICNLIVSLKKKEILQGVMIQQKYSQFCLPPYSETFEGFVFSDLLW